MKLYWQLRMTTAEVITITLALADAAKACRTQAHALGLAGGDRAGDRAGDGERGGDGERIAVLLERAATIERVNDSARIVFEPELVKDTMVREVTVW